MHPIEVKISKKQRVSSLQLTQKAAICEALSISLLLNLLTNFSLIRISCTNPGDIHKFTRFLHLHPQIEQT